jgi:hypothetical protein
MMTVVTGLPCSGKSMYVQSQANPGDIIIDLDKLAQALGSPVSHGHTRPIKSVAIVARRAAIAEAIKHHLRGAVVWVIESQLNDVKLRSYKRVNAQVIELTADTAELHRRATAANRPPEWHYLIDRLAH